MKQELRKADMGIAIRADSPLVIQFYDEGPEIFYVHWNREENWTPRECTGKYCLVCMDGDRATRYFRWFVAGDGTISATLTLHNLLWEKLHQIGRKRFFSASWRIEKYPGGYQTSYELVSVRKR